jgi:murein DD-endopeptidase MepM/ murein hydrolase activator NlpD
VVGWQVSQAFGNIWWEQYSEYGGKHNGIDIACPVGTLVKAAAEGVVVHAGTDPVRPARGVHLIISHDFKLMETHYLHLKRLWCEAGDRVRQGQVIAESGNTGGVAPHLHWGLRDMQALASDTKGFVDPAEYVA